MRNFAPTRQRKHKGGNSKDVASIDSNSTEHTPVSVLEKNAKKRKLAEELRNEGPKISGKKAKRLEKYIDNKLKKDENRELIEKLAQTKTDTSLFQSSSRLGQGKETKKQAMTRAMRERQNGIDVDGNNKELLFSKKPRHKAPSVERTLEDSDEEEKLEIEVSFVPLCTLMWC